MDLSFLTEPEPPKPAADRLDFLGTPEPVAEVTAPQNLIHKLRTIKEKQARLAVAQEEPEIVTTATATATGTATATAMDLDLDVDTAPELAPEVPKELTLTELKSELEKFEVVEKKALEWLESGFAQRRVDIGAAKIEAPNAAKAAAQAAARVQGLELELQDLLSFRLLKKHFLTRALEDEKALSKLKAAKLHAIQEIADAPIREHVHRVLMEAQKKVRGIKEKIEILEPTPTHEQLKALRTKVFKKKTIGLDANEKYDASEDERRRAHYAKIYPGIDFT